MTTRETIVVVFVLRDGNEREFFHAFDEDAAWDAETEAMLDRRFGGPRDVVFVTLQGEG